MKNLVVLHLESINLQRFSAFRESFPHTMRLMQDALVFDNYVSSATSTLMVITYLLHGNDFEFDRQSDFDRLRPAVNNPNLFSILERRGYHANFTCLSGFHATQGVQLACWPESLPPLWGTNDFPTLFERFDALTNEPPFAIYAWDLITHIEHSLALATVANGITDQIRRACAVADDALGVMMGILERKNLLQNTTVVVYGDHGDDYWTHGFKNGMVHGTEPYTQITATPFVIRDPALQPGINNLLASTIDIAPTCLALLGIDEPLAFAHSGVNLLQHAPEIVFSQNFTANQPDNPRTGIVKAFSAADDTYVLLASSRGLELYAYRLDPGNHCNLLQFFTFTADGGLSPQRRPDAAGHFRAALEENPGAIADIAAHFRTLRARLAERIVDKRAFIIEGGVEPAFALDPLCLERIAGGALTPTHPAHPNAPAPQTPASLHYSFRLG